MISFSRGVGYEEDPSVTAIGGGGVNAIITATLGESLGVYEFEVVNQGAGYPEDAAILVYDDDNNIIAEGLALTDGEKIVQAIVTNTGDRLPFDVKAVVDAPAAAGEGIYLYNEIIVGKESGMKARVRGWNAKTFQLEITNLDPEEDKIDFKPGEIIEGEKSGARYSLKSFSGDQTPADGFSQNDEIQVESNEIVDDTEYNQFFNPNEDTFSPDNPFGE